MTMGQIGDWWYIFYPYFRSHPYLHPVRSPIAGEKSALSMSPKEINPR